MLFQKTTNLPCGRRVCVLFISLLTTFLFSSCKSDCEKAAEFSATDYETASSAMDHKLIIDMKCKAEIDKLGLDKKEAAQKYCDYTKNCSEINEEERQAKIAELKSQVENNCPNEKNKLNKDLNNEQRQNCWNSKKAYMEFSGDKERSHYYWSLGSSALGIAKAKYFRKSEPTGVIITATRYIYTDEGLLVCIDAMNQSKMSTVFTDDNMSFFVGGKRVKESSVAFTASFNDRVLKRGDMKIFCWLYKSDSYHTYEDYEAMKLNVYFNDDTIGLARVFPTVGPVNKNDDLRELSDAMHSVEWPHIGKGYTSNDWLFDLNGVDSMKYRKVYDSQESCLEEMKKAGII